MRGKEIERDRETKRETERDREREKREKVTFCIAYMQAEYDPYNRVCIEIGTPIFSFAERERGEERKIEKR